MLKGRQGASLSFLAGITATGQSFFGRSVQVGLGGGELLQDFERNDIQRMMVGAFQHDPGRSAGQICLFPAQRAQAPLVTILQARKSILGNRSAQVVAAAGAECEEIRGHHGTDDMRADVIDAGLAAAVPEETGERIEGTRNQRFTQDIGGGRRWSIHAASIAPSYCEGDEACKLRA